MKALIIPLDNRPVTYTFPQLICHLAGVTPLAPPRSVMSSLSQPQSPEPLWNWMDNVLADSKPDALIICADSLIYGGLINSRRCTDTAAQLLSRVNRLSSWKSNMHINARAGAHDILTLVQSSIMRISDNYDATEEKTYWSQYGREIFAWSGHLHRLARGENLNPGVLNAIEYKIPANIREDYLATRRRNFQVSQRLLELVESHIIDLLVFSLDDSGEWGLNIHETERLAIESKKKALTDRILIYPGADEVLCTLIARWLIIQSKIHNNQNAPSVKLQFSTEKIASIPSRYEGRNIGATVQSQIHAAGLNLTNDNCDFLILVHGCEERQGDHILLPGEPDLRQLDTSKTTKSTLALLEAAQTPVVLCDLAYANGADPLLCEELLKRPDLLKKLWGYAGWNTTGNTTGSALAMGIANWYAKNQNNSPQNISNDELKRCLFIRFADDWAYQTKVRRQLDGHTPPATLAKLMEPYLKQIAESLNYQPGIIAVRQPWQRTFEIEIEVEK